ncbi:MAG: putative methylthioribose-1-phosphate isomerase [ANME-2 cluster archaeon HR1]|nr:methylthioribose-1-phosphate isomerase [ANME-2 cluster archaeon]PPA79345.1 MAG: putative methylthioribose-1-phosphate isomerase [ANME-2 cluster archaeon HR1]
MRTIDWNSENNTIIMVDQTLLPAKYKLIECSSIECLCEAISSLRVRGAPAIGAAGGFGIALAGVLSHARSMEALINELKQAGDMIISTRPTAVNLAWAVNRVLNATMDAYNLESIRDIVLHEALAIADEDAKLNKKIGINGAKLLKDGDMVMTYCNAGRLACVDWGTALGVIRSAVEMGKEIQVIACETRPLNQGGRITTLELMEDKIPVTLITDSMSAHVMRCKKVDCVIVGADRITQDAVFNKIGTYTLSIVANEHDIPFYVAAPVSTFDFINMENDIEIELRNPDEMRFMAGTQIAPLDVNVYNPAFDATPMGYVSALITENGIFKPPLLLEEVTLNH